MSIALSRNNLGKDQFVVPIGTTGIDRHRLRPGPKPAGQQRANLEAMARHYHRFRLSNEAGELLHLSVAPDGTALLFTTAPEHAWIGFAANLQKLGERFPETKTLRPVRVLRDARSEILHSRKV